MKKRMRIGLVGAGGMAAYHIPGFRKAGADVVAIAAEIASGRLGAVNSARGDGRVAAGHARRRLLESSLRH